MRRRSSPSLRLWADPVSLPTTTKAAFVRSNGPASSIEFGELPIPTFGPTDVLDRVGATAVNHVDLFVRSGAYPTPTPFPFILGRDLVGTVVATGAGVETHRTGDKVWCNSLGHAGRQGTFAEYAAVPAERLYPLPPGVDPTAGVAVLHAAGTAYIGLFREAHLALGETVFVNGTGGGVGSAVVQLAHAAGARVVAAAAPRDHDWCTSIGADTVLDYADPNLTSAIGSAAPAGVDIWWDNSGHNDLAQAPPLLNTQGRIVMMAGMTAQPTFTAGALYTRDLSILGFAISNASVTDLAVAAQTINALFRSGGLRARVGSVLRLTESRKAYEMTEVGRRGRIVVVP